MQGLVRVNPFRCRMWDLHDRLPEYLSEQSCASELESVRQHGQRVPALGRPTNDRGYDVELIYGARRLLVARALNVDLLVNVRNLSDEEALIEMDIENRARKDISPYERGVSYKRFIREGFFKTQVDLAKALGLSTARVSRLLKFAELPTVVLDAFPSPLEIRESWAITLADKLEDRACRQRIVETARRLVSTKESTRDAASVMKSLLNSLAIGRKLRETTRDDVVPATDGKILFRVSRRRRDVHIILPISIVSEDAMSKIKEHLRLALGSDHSHQTAKGP